MATSEEKQELVDQLSGSRFYRIQISGYGGESAYMSISKEAHDFWQPICEEHGDYDLVQYMNCDDLEECEFENIDTVPVEAQFLNDPDDDMYKRPWYESHTEFEHSYGAEYGSAYLSVEEVDSEEYSAKNINEVMYNKDINELNNKVLEETDNEVEVLEMGCCDDNPEGVEYIAQLYSSEKGGFFDGIIETVGDFDPKKLKIYTTEYLNGEDTITSIEYDGVDIDNQGGDTNGKGYYASVWKN
jgi:hypothetical protein